MKVKIKTKKCRLLLYLPTALLFSNLEISLLLRTLKDYICIPSKDRNFLAERLKKKKKEWKGLCLVEVKTSAGEEIMVIL